MILMTMDQLVPKNHIIRKMERNLDLSFIYDEVKDLYSNVGQNFLDSIVFSRLF
jgi:hypothetical protein